MAHPGTDKEDFAFLGFDTVFFAVDNGCHQVVVALIGDNFVLRPASGILDLPLRQQNFSVDLDAWGRFAARLPTDIGITIDILVDGHPHQPGLGQIY